ncbi:MAG: sigma-70 family RNA polymerase sigma factor [Phycisphaerae bacterium]|nr:sigma-70 family RNA polymerase sigma factor [Phycisphaerae bacterium]
MGSSGQNPLRQTASGERDALRQLLKEHGPGVRRQLAGKIPGRWQAVLSVDDVMQQTYTDVFLNVDRFVPQGDASLAAWLLKIADHNLIDALRMLEADKRGKDRRRIQPETREESFVAFYELLSAGGATPSRLVARDEARAALERAVEQLPDAYRQVVLMFDLEGRPMEEVARALNRSPGAAYMIRVRAHRRLRELMGTPSEYFSTA